MGSPALKLGTYPEHIHLAVVGHLGPAAIMQIPKILLVDDEADLRAALAMIIEDAGYQVTSTWNGRLGLELLRREPASVVVLDLEMPILDGLQFCEAKLRDPGLAPIPVVVLSAHPDLGERIRPPGVAEWLRKPFDVAVLLTTIRRLTQTPAPHEVNPARQTGLRT